MVYQKLTVLSFNPGKSKNVAGLIEVLRSGLAKVRFMEIMLIARLIFRFTSILFSEKFQKLGLGNYLKKYHQIWSVPTSQWVSLPGAGCDCNWSDG